MNDKIERRNPACGIVREELEHRGISQAQACADLMVTKGFLSQVVNYKKDISGDFALKLEAYLGINADIFLKVQTGWKLRNARIEKATELLEIKKKAETFASKSDPRMTLAG